MNIAKRSRQKDKSDKKLVDKIDKSVKIVSQTKRIKLVSHETDSPKVLKSDNVNKKVKKVDKKVVSPAPKVKSLSVKQRTAIRVN